MVAISKMDLAAVAAHFDVEQARKITAELDLSTAQARFNCSSNRLFELQHELLKLVSEERPVRAVKVEGRPRRAVVVIHPDRVFAVDVE